MHREEILERVRDLICNKRNNEYGEPSKNMDAIAELWRAYFRVRNKCTEMHSLDGNDVAAMLMLMKLARSLAIKRKSTKEDSLLDLAGYAAIFAELYLRVEPHSPPAKETKT